MCRALPGGRGCPARTADSRAPRVRRRAGPAGGARDVTNRGTRRGARSAGQRHGAAHPVGRGTAARLGLHPRWRRAIARAAVDGVGRVPRSVRGQRLRRVAADLRRPRHRVARRAHGRRPGDDSNRDRGAPRRGRVPGSGRPVALCSNCRTGGTGLPPRSRSTCFHGSASKHRAGGIRTIWSSSSSASSRPPPTTS